VHNSFKQVVFVTPELPTEQGAEGLAIARITEALPLDWKVKALVVRSQMLSISKIPKLLEFEIILIPEPQLHWDTLVLQFARLPLEKLAQVESINIAQRILSHVRMSDYTFVFPTSPVLKLVSRELGAVYSAEKHWEDLGISLETGGEKRIQVLLNQPSNSPETKWGSLFEKAHGSDFHHGTFRTDVSNAFDFDPSLTRKYASPGQEPIKTIGAESKNRIVNWSISSQPILESGIVILSPKIDFLLRPSRITLKALEFATKILTSALYGLLKIGYAAAKLLFKVLSGVRIKILEKR